MHTRAANKPARLVTERTILLDEFLPAHRLGIPVTVRVALVHGSAAER